MVRGVIRGAARLWQRLLTACPAEEQTARVCTTHFWRRGHQKPGDGRQLAAESAAVLDTALDPHTVLCTRVAARADVATARAHTQVWAELAAAGQMIGPHDLWLAATCIVHGFTIVTANVREFARVPGFGGRGLGQRSLTCPTTTNTGLEPTPYSVRCAPAFRRGSGPALGGIAHPTRHGKMEEAQYGVRESLL